MKTEIEKFQSGFSGMPGVSQNHDGSTKRRLQPILLVDEPLGYGSPHHGPHTAVHVDLFIVHYRAVRYSCTIHSTVQLYLEGTTTAVPVPGMAGKLRTPHCRTALSV